jgi:response regulator of citrate/malate metabolism
MKQQTKKALSGLEWALAQSIDEPQQPEEFTAEDFAKAGGVTMDSAKARLARMVRQGLLAKRIVCLRGRRTGLYRRA